MYWTKLSHIYRANIIPASIIFTMMETKHDIKDFYNPNFNTYMRFGFSNSIIGCTADCIWPLVIPATIIQQIIKK